MAIRPASLVVVPLFLSATGCCYAFAVSRQQQQQHVRQQCTPPLAFGRRRRRTWLLSANKGRDESLEVHAIDDEATKETVAGELLGAGGAPLGYAHLDDIASSGSIDELRKDATGRLPGDGSGVGATGEDRSKSTDGGDGAAPGAGVADDVTSDDISAMSMDDELKKSEMEKKMDVLNKTLAERKSHARAQQQRQKQTIAPPEPSSTENTQNGRQPAAAEGERNSTAAVPPVLDLDPPLSADTGDDNAAKQRSANAVAEVQEVEMIPQSKYDDLLHWVFGPTSSSLSEEEEEDTTEPAPGQGGQPQFHWALGGAPPTSSTLPPVPTSSSSSLTAPKVKIAPSKIGTGYGLYTSTATSSGDILCEIPLSKCLTLQKAYEHESMGRYMQYMTDEGEGGRLCSLASLVAAELLRVDVAEWKKGKGVDVDSTSTLLRSAYDPYLRILPVRRGVNGQDHVLFWTDDETDATFGWGSIEHEEVLALQDWAEDEGEGMFQMLVSDLVSRNEGLSMRQVQDAVTAGFVCVLSRSVELVQKGGGTASADGQLGLVPVLDMVQHSSRPNVRHWVDDARGVLVVQATKNFMAGAELCMDWSGDYQVPEFFVLFGFQREAAEDITASDSVAQVSSLDMPSNGDNAWWQ